jgi:hypothetical protein
MSRTNRGSVDMVDVKLLEKFKNLEIKKSDLCSVLGENLVSISIDEPLTVKSTDVINVLSAYKDGKLKLENLLDWTNTVWFTDLFDYDDNECDSIASVMDKLEELDEREELLSVKEIDTYILALENNQELS